MIQTFEGALQESHSILQRMKELAAESANGTYQTEVDRDAIQLEFNQLNDELDQISDTDFNGTVMLNGGQMADGTKAINGNFDYVNGTKAATKLGKNDVNVVDSQAWDNTDVAKTAWGKLNAQWTRTAGSPSTNGPDSVDITFKYNDADGTWAAISASNGADVSKVTTTATTDGGFGIKIDTAAVANVVINQEKLGNGDTITLTFNNPANGISAPTNQGADITDSTNFTEGSQGLKLIGADLTVTKGEVTDADMTQDINDMFAQLDGANIEMKYTDAATAKGDMTITLNNGTVLNNKADGTVTIGSTTFTFKATDTGFEISGGGKKLVTLAGANQATTTTAGDATKKNATGSISYKLGFEDYEYDAGAKPTIEVAKTGNVSKANSNNAATAPLTYTDHLVLQTGARTKDSVDFTFEYQTEGMGELKANLNVSSRADGLNTKNLSLNTQEDANAAIDKIDNAINKVSMVRATFGATQNRLEHKVENLTTTAENLTEAESGIRDTDMAQEMLNYTKFNVLQQAAQSMLAQANQQPQSILQLLG